MMMMIYERRAGRIYSYERIDKCFGGLFFGGLRAESGSLISETRTTRSALDVSKVERPGKSILRLD